jgi:hypothetical protein
VAGAECHGAKLADQRVGQIPGIMQILFGAGLLAAGGPRLATCRDVTAGHRMLSGDSG